MTDDLISVIMKIAPSATGVVQQLLTFKSKPTTSELNIVLLATIVEQNNKSLIVINETLGSVRELRSDLVRKGVL